MPVLPAPSLQEAGARYGVGSSGGCPPPPHSPPAPSPSPSVPAVHDDGAGAAPVALVHLPARTRGGSTSAPCPAGGARGGGSGPRLPPSPPVWDGAGGGGSGVGGRLRPRCARGTLHAAGTAANDHFCDYATGARLLAANHKNDAGSCERGTDRQTHRQRDRTTCPGTPPRHPEPVSGAVPPPGGRQLTCGSRAGAGWWRGCRRPAS